MAECTGGNWLEGWRVGECPDELENATLQVITLENCEQSIPEQITASYNVLAVSTVSLDISSACLTQGASVTLSGQLSPSLQNKTITIYIKANGLPWSELSTVATASNGSFMYVWCADVFGICYFRASWSGNGDYAPADSPIRTVTVLSWSFIVLLSLIAILVGVGTVLFLMRQPRSELS
jgi:hypothetical protein